jgi:serine phosphatase RsbU (regulator of sigma subunit)
MSAVLMSAAAINSLRSSRRTGIGLAAAYRQADETIATQFGHSFYVTVQFGSIDIPTGVLTWINADRRSTTVSTSSLTSTTTGTPAPSPTPHGCGMR